MVAVLQRTFWLLGDDHRWDGTSLDGRRACIAHLPRLLIRSTIFPAPTIVVLARLRVHALDHRLSARPGRP